MPEPVQTANRPEQISFAKFSFDNQQSLIRFADAKTGAYATFMLFLATTTFTIAKDVLPKLRWVWSGGLLSSAIFLLGLGIFGGAFIWAFIHFFRVVSPRQPKHYESSRVGHEILYYEHVAAHRDMKEYRSAISGASPDLVLQNIADQVFELAHICQRKMRGLSDARIPMSIALGTWAITSFLGLWIERWK